MKLLAEHWAPNFCLEGTHVLGLSKADVREWQ